MAKGLATFSSVPQRSSQQQGLSRQIRLHALTEELVTSVFEENVPATRAAIARMALLVFHFFHKKCDVCGLFTGLKSEYSTAAADM